MNRERLRVVLAVYLATIYCTLGVIRPFTNYLRDHRTLRPTVAVLFALAAIVTLLVIFRQRRNRTWSVVGALALTGAGYAAAIYPMDSPEEKVHFIEYGVVALLVDASSPAEWSARKRFLLSALFVLAAGWIDEGIQAILPDRYYDLRDVFFDAAAGVMALVTLAVIRFLTARRETPAPAG
jgi:4-amino-4-deoxy-L-arabinose transferase-like glycosyltransferase